MRRPQNLRPIRMFGPLFLVVFGFVGSTRAQPGDAAPGSPEGPASGPANPSATETGAEYAGKPIRSLEIVQRGRWFRERLDLRWVKLSDPFSPSGLRRAVRD